MPGDRRIEVELLPHDPAIAHRDRRYPLEAFEQPLRLDAAMRLDVSDHHILARSAHALRRLEHRVRLAHSRRSAKENAQATALRARLFCLDMSQELIRVRPYFGHAVRSPQGASVIGCSAHAQP